MRYLFVAAVALTVALATSASSAQQSAPASSRKKKKAPAKPKWVDRIKSAYTPPVRKKRKPLKPPCFGVRKSGCCVGEMLYFCERNKLKTIDCRKSGRLRCGFRPTTDHFDCGTAGSGDPTSTHAMMCPFGINPPASVPKEQSSCGDITVEGCCFGNELRFCNEGLVETISCARNSYCGWRPAGQFYNCGTPGQADPQGQHPRDCEGAPRYHPRPFVDATPEADEQPGGDGKVKRPASSNASAQNPVSSSCVVSAGRDGPWPQIAVILFGLFCSRQRKRRRKEMSQ